MQTWFFCAFHFQVRTLHGQTDRLAVWPVGWPVPCVYEEHCVSRAQGKLRSVEFHRSAQIVLTAGMDQTLRLFQVCYFLAA